MEVGGQQIRKLVLRPEHGHPSSLWGEPPRDESVGIRPYVTEEDFNLSEALTRKLHSWTAYFQDMFVSESSRFDDPPVWRPGSKVEEWNKCGHDIVSALKEELVDYFVEDKFDTYVYSVNECRRRNGLPPFVPGPGGR